MPYVKSSKFLEHLDKILELAEEECTCVEGMCVACYARQEVEKLNKQVKVILEQTKTMSKFN